MCRTFFIWAVLLLGACADPLTPDQAELQNIHSRNRVPKSSPSQLVMAFDTFCVSAKANRTARETLLRQADYVPMTRRQTGELQLFLVDDRRPAILLNEKLCSARALSRTGQTERLQGYIESTFRDARALSPHGVNSEVEQLWYIESMDPFLIATERGHSLDGLTTYAITLFRP